MSPADSDSATISKLLNLALFVWGAVVWWRFQFVSSTAQYRIRRLPSTTISLTEFFYKAFVLFVGMILGAFALLQLGHFAPHQWTVDPSFNLFASNIGLDFGGVAALLACRKTPQWVLPYPKLNLEAFGQIQNRERLPQETVAPPLPRNQILKAGVFTYFAATAAVMVVQPIWLFLLDKFHIDAPRQPVVDVLQGHHPLGIFLLAGFLAVVLAPIGEEMVFRAGLFRYIQQILPRWAAFLISAVLFGAMHLSLSASVSLIVFAYVLSLSYERTGRISVPMIAHGLFNLTSLIGVLLGWDS